MINPTRRSDIGLFDLFSDLEEAERTLLNQKVSMRSFLKGRIVYLPGDACSAIYLIHRGKVKLSRYATDGREIILDFRKATEICGEMALTACLRQDDVAEAVEDSLIGILHLVDVQWLLATNLHFNRQIIRLIGLHLKHMQSRYESLCFQGAPERIKDFIREQADQRGQQVGVEIDLKMNLTHQDIGKLTVTSRQTVTTVLKELERNQVISYNRKRILIRNYPSLL
jgi:CRP/FNR family transcriptional regulator, cyclic AMP receptor protein